MIQIRLLFQEKILNIPNTLSILRLILFVPALYLLHIYKENPHDLIYLFFAALFLGLSAISDFFDGWAARRYNQQTMLGQYLDPICDKIVAVGSLFIMVVDYHFPLWIFVIYIFRETGGIFLGTLLFIRHNMMGTPNQWGKAMVLISSLSILWYVLQPYLSTRFAPDHILREPWWSAYSLLVVIVIGSIRYMITYIPILLNRQSLDR